MKPYKIRQNYPQGYYSLLLLWAGIMILSGNNSVRAEEERVLSGIISVEGGSLQAPGSALSASQYSRLSLESHQDILKGLSLGLEGEANWQSSGAPMAPSWPPYPTPNVLKLETDNLSSSDGEDLYSLRFNRAYLHFASG